MGAAAPGAAQVAGSIAVYPAASSVESGGTRQFASYVPISPNTITWAVNGIVGGSSAYGTISPTGLYTAPVVIPAANTVTIAARSVAFPASVGSTTLRITRPTPNLWGVSPASVPIGQFAVTLNGEHFAPDSQVLAGGVPIQTTFLSSQQLYAIGVALTAGPLSFSVRQPAPGEITGNALAVTVQAPAPTISVSPGSTTLALGATQAFGVSVSGTNDSTVIWSVNGLTGGSLSIGTINAFGVYTAPRVTPTYARLAIRATSASNPTLYGEATVTLQSPVTVTMTPTTASVELGQSQVFSARVSGVRSQGITWMVNGRVGGSSEFGTVSSAGTYTAPARMPATRTVTVRAASTQAPAVAAQATVTLTVPAPASVSLTAGRFLEQSSFGPTPSTLARVGQLGIPAYLDEQLAAPETSIPLPADNSMGSLRNWMLHTYTAAPDQLRQRVMYALSQIIVTSGNKLIYADEMVPWLRLLSQHAFGNYRDLLHDVTRSASMGKYLDLANSMKPGAAGGANENYPRELMQLFTIGLWRLNQDGSLLLDAGGQPIPAYTQDTVRQVALALTGWTYATAPGQAPRTNNNEYFGAPMETRPSSHDLTAKSFLGCSLPAGQTAEQDLDGVIDCLMQHPNMAPFVATRLIRSLVMSNPSPQYIARVAAVFAGAQGGVRGDLRATVRAVLMDSEARQDVATSTQGRLKEPILQISGLLRALGGGFSATNEMPWIFDHLGQMILSPNSVFSWFSPLYRVPNSALFGPEFQIYSPAEATLRGNIFYSILNSQSGGDVTIDLSPFRAYGDDLPALVELANQVLLYGRMPAGMKQAIVTAAAPGYDEAARITTVLYLTALSGQYAVQH